MLFYVLKILGDLAVPTIKCPQKQPIYLKIQVRQPITFNQNTYEIRIFAKYLHSEEIRYTNLLPISRNKIAEQICQCHKRP